MTGVPVVLLVVVAVVGLVVAAALSAGEAALLRITKTAAGEVTANGRPSGSRVARLLSDEQRTAAAASTLRLVGEMTAAACITMALAAAIDAWWVVLLLAAAVNSLTAIMLVRLSPRSIGRDHPAATLSAVSGLFALAVALTTPLHRVSPTRRTMTQGLSEEEILDLVDRAGAVEGIEEDEREMLHSVFELAETRAREVMVPRPDMVTIQAGTTLPKALSLFLRSGYSRVPVVGASVDDLLGILYFKDVVKRLSAAPEDSGVPVEQVMRPAVFAPESKRVDDLLAEMQQGSHQVIVVDEYGGVAGLVTIEDVLEELVGEVADEHDQHGPEIEDLGGGVFRVPSRLPADELGELFDLAVDDDDVDSAGGLLAKALGRVPIPGSAADIHGLHLVADRVEGRRKRLATLLVSRAESASQEQSAGAGTEER